jgi:hypothetical protein
MFQRRKKLTSRIDLNMAWSPDEVLTQTIDEDVRGDILYKTLQRMFGYDADCKEYLPVQPLTCLVAQLRTLTYDQFISRKFHVFAQPIRGFAIHLGM